MMEHTSISKDAEELTPAARITFVVTYIKTSYFKTEFLNSFTIPATRDTGPEPSVRLQELMSDNFLIISFSG